MIVRPCVELIYDRDCPNVGAARRALLRGFAAAALTPAWVEWDRQAPESPLHARRFGSPTILVDGRDVASADASADGNCCRLYMHASGELFGAPSVAAIVDALRRDDARAPARRSRWDTFAAAPGIGAALLPVGACPACWPAYAAVIGSLGLGFLLDAAYLLPLTVLLLGVALFALAYRATSRRGHGPLLLGLGGAALILIFKFAYTIEPLFYSGLTVLTGATVWNAWPIRRRSGGSCPNCAPVELRRDTTSAT